VKGGSNNKMVKKTAAKKQSVIVVAPDEQRFWVCNGLVLKDINELASALESMSDENFMYHANPERNDFSNWVADILLDKTLANTLKRSKTRESAIKAVKGRIATLK